MVSQLDIFAPRFDGQTYDHSRDHERLTSQLGRVRGALKGGQWLTLAQLAKLTGAPQASVSARLRDLRKLKFGGHNIERRYLSRGLFEYRMVA